MLVDTYAGFCSMRKPLPDEFCCDMLATFEASHLGFKIVFSGNITRGFSEEMEEAAKKDHLALHRPGGRGSRALRGMAGAFRERRGAAA